MRACPHLSCKKLKKVYSTSAPLLLGEGLGVRGISLILTFSQREKEFNYSPCEGGGWEGVLL